MALRSSRYIAVVSLLLVAGLVIWGCGGLTLAKILPPGTIKTPAGNPILSTFTSTTISSPSVSAACPGSISVSGTNYACTAEVRKFNSDGSWTSTNPNPGGTTSGTYGFSPDLTMLTITDNGTTTTGTIVWGSSNAYFDFTVNGVTLRWVKQ
jgi:hypothetical protein